MKSFKDFIKNNEKTGLITTPIHFKHSFIEYENDGLIHTPIHFKHVNESSLPHIKTWASKNDNRHLGRSSLQIADELRNTPKNISQKESDHVYNHTNNSTPLNTALIENGGKVEKLEKLHQDRVKALDKVIDRNRIRHRLTVYSGTTFDPRKVVNRDGIMKSPAYISATHSKKTAMRFSKGKAEKGKPRHILSVQLHPGSNASHISHLSRWQDENETIIGRNSELRHIKTEQHTDDEGNVTHIHHFELH